MSKQLYATGERAFFAAGNSRLGFHSYFESCFRDRVSHLLCIKGGPGTGKNTLMRTVAREGERRGYRGEYYYCSSDPDSLDAVLLFDGKRSVGLVDATAPHIFEGKLPGVQEEIVDLGQFWHRSRLLDRQADIVLWNQQKADGYRDAYRYLAGVGEVSDVLYDLTLSTIDTSKLERTASRLLRGIASQKGGQVRIGLCDSIGMRGRVTLDTYLHLGERLCLIADYYDSGFALMRRLANGAFERGIALRVSYHPILPDRIDALFLEDSKTVFLVGERQQMLEIAERMPHARLIDMRRLVRRDQVRASRDRIRGAARLREALLDGACDALKEVKQAHFKLEEAYATAMDFEAKERYTGELCRRLFEGESDK